MNSVDTEFAETMAFVQEWMAGVDETTAGDVHDRLVGALYFEGGQTLYAVIWIDEDDGPQVRLWDVQDDHALDEVDIHHLWDHHSREGAIEELEEHAEAYR